MSFEWQHRLLYHAGGTKFYRAIYIADKSGRTSVGICIKSYGPIGKKGQVLVEESSIGGANNEWSNILEAKCKRGYTNQRVNEDAILDADELMRDLRAIFGAGHLEVLDEVRIVFGLTETLTDGELVADPFGEDDNETDAKKAAEETDDTPPPARPEEWGSW